MHLQTRPTHSYCTPYNLVFKIGPSKVHGRGLVAARDIAEGEEIGMAVAFNAEHPLLTDMAKYVNHSVQPNSCLQPVAAHYCLVASRPIKADEEILADHNSTPSLDIFHNSLF